jgi:hypothetical protein
LERRQLAKVDKSYQRISSELPSLPRSKPKDKGFVAWNALVLGGESNVLEGCVFGGQSDRATAEKP